MIEFVYFDLGNVLWKFDEARACQNVADLLGRTRDEVRSAIYGDQLQTGFEHGTVSPGGFVKKLLSDLNIEGDAVDPQDVLDAASNMFEPIESMVDVVQAVRDRGTKVGILSNTCHAHWDWIKRQDHPLMSGPFDAVVLSFEVNSMKPDDQIYRAAELVAGVDTQNILFLDDKAENVSAARMRGWKSVQCTGGESALAALKRYEVIV